MAEALLIGFLIGAQREASREEAERQPGVRDFTLIAMVGAFCGLIDSDWVIGAALGFGELGSGRIERAPCLTEVDGTVEPYEEGPET